MHIQSDQIAAARLDETRRLAERPERRALRELRACRRTAIAATDEVRAVRGATCRCPVETAARELG